MSRRKGVMLCYPFEEKRLAKWHPPYIVQPKFDGDRCSNTYFGEDSFMLFSSEENPFYSVPHINKQMKEGDIHRFPLDGELYSHALHKEGGHELIHSIASRTVNLHHRYEELEFHIFDLKYPHLYQYNRLIRLNELEAQFGPNIKLAPYIVCNTLDEIKRAYDDILKRGYEGIVVRHFEAQYMEKRSIYVMKFKPKKKDSYTIVGWNEEVSIHGEKKGIIGSIICSSQEGEKFSVGAGLDQDQKRELWKIKDEIIGYTAIVHYQHLTNKKVPKGTFDIQIPEAGIV